MTATVGVSISAVVAGRFPGVSVAGFAAFGLAEAAGRVQVPTTGEVAAGLAGAGVGLENLAAQAPIEAWRAASTACGLKPSTFKSSAEALARRYLKGDGVSCGLGLVDLYCAVSAAHLAPLGGYDLDRLPDTHVMLRPARPGDVFAPIGGAGGGATMVLDDRVVVYAAAETVMCWHFNHRDSTATCLGSGTDGGLFIGEAITAAHAGRLRDALGDLRVRLDAAGAHLGPLFWLDASHLDVDVDVAVGVDVTVEVNVEDGA